MTCYILEDEPFAIENLKDYIKEWPDLDLLGASRDPISGINEINELHPDVLFLDINMPKLSGFEVLENLKTTPLIVFTTAYSKYALNGYEFEPVDYLLKPIALSRFLKTVQRLEKRLSAQKSQQNISQTVVIKDGRKQHFIETSDLFFIKSDRDYLEYHHKGGIIVSIGALRNEEERLKNLGFVRVHNSYVVNQSHVNVISASKLALNGVEIPIGRSFKKAAFQLFSKNDQGS